MIPGVAALNYTDSYQRDLGFNRVSETAESVGGRLESSFDSATGITTRYSALLRLGRGDVGTGETIASPPPTSTIPSYYQEVGGGFRKQYCGLPAGSANTGN